ncbi:MAG: SMP-30/gluconolactonase/LRE family protein [Burkholderiales bacterium]
MDGTGRRVGKPSIWRLNPRNGNVENWSLDRDVGAMALRQGSGIICSYGPCWSPDDRIFYFADTFQGEYWAYDFDIGTGTLSNKRLFASFKDDPGVADGSTIDSEGCVWNAQLIAGDLVRYAPDGSVERRITTRIIL